MRGGTEEYRITFRRAGWLQRRSVFRQNERTALAFVRKLRGNGRPDLAPVVELLVERREVGPWREVKRYDD